MTDYKLVPTKATPEMEQAAEKYWNERRFKGFSADPRTWQGVYAAMLTASPAPEHSGDGNEMVPALRQYRHNYGGGFVFAYDKEQTDRIVTGLVKALEKIEAYEITSSPDFGVSFDRAIWTGVLKEIARDALAEYRKQGGGQ